MLCHHWVPNSNWWAPLHSLLHLSAMFMIYEALQSSRPGLLLPGLRSVVATLNVVWGTSARSLERGIPGTLEMSKRCHLRWDLGEKAEADFPWMKLKLQGPLLAQIARRSLPNFVFFFFKMAPSPQNLRFKKLEEEYQGLSQAGSGPLPTVSWSTQEEPEAYELEAEAWANLVGFHSNVRIYNSEIHPNL